MTQICAWLFAQPAAPAILPGAAASAPQASSEASRPGAAHHAPLAPGVPQVQAVPPPPPPAVPDATAVAGMDAFGLLQPEGGADVFMDLLSDRELDFLIADLAGDDAGHLLAASSPHLH